MQTDEVADLIFAKVANSLERVGSGVCPLVILVNSFSIPFDISLYVIATVSTLLVKGLLLLGCLMCLSSTLVGADL